MKNVIKMVSLSSILVLSACNSNPATIGIDTTTADGISGTNNCTLASDGAGGFTGTCADGTTIAVPGAALAQFKGVTGATGTAGTNGANGINGTNGTNGAAGTNGTNGSNGTNGTNAPTYLLKDANNNTIGTSVVSFNPTNSGAAYVLWDSTAAVFVSYMASGLLTNTDTEIYYSSTNCTGNLFVPNYVAQNTIVEDANQNLYTVSQTVATFASGSYSTGNVGNCTIAATASQAWSQIHPFTATTAVPVRLALPVSLQL